MHAFDEIRPAPRTTPLAVLWLMVAVVIGGSGLLVFATSPTAPTTPYATSKPRPTTSADRSLASRAAPTPGPAPARSTLQVP